MAAQQKHHDGSHENHEKTKVTVGRDGQVKVKAAFQSQDEFDSFVKGLSGSSTSPATSAAASSAACKEHCVRCTAGNPSVFGRQETVCTPSIGTALAKAYSLFGLGSSFSVTRGACVPPKTEVKLLKEATKEEGKAAKEAAKEEKKIHEKEAKEAKHAAAPPKAHEEKKK